ncbi:distal tail protein Dit [Halalkalibacter alkalisediminis]|uniref:Distal tail protein Dit n=1 Tax=Halalkalibacter alkalisediminis TaxID=935616 RepID=A0ABV6NHR5_9BACI|nr:distal tail protein Dit [Halalkalibacter alkalisediminis]
MITFNGTDLSEYVIIRDIKRDISPPKNLVTQHVSGMHGVYLTRVDTLPHMVEVSIMFSERDLPTLRKKVREFSGIINTDTPKPIVFHDEPDVYYNGILTNETPLNEQLAIGQATITFLLPDPIAWGDTQERALNVFSNSVDFKRDSIAYTTDYQLVSVNTPRYAPSNFGKAILIEEGTTNIIPNADQLFDYTFKVFNVGQQGSNISGGVATIEFTRDGVNGDCRLQSPSFVVSKNQGHIYSFDIKHDVGDFELYAIGSAVDDFAEGEKPIGILSVNGTFTGNYGVTLINTKDLGDGFKRLVISFPSNFFSAGSGNEVRISHWHGWAGTASYQYQFRKPQMEIGKTMPTSFTEETRAGEKLELPTGFNIKHDSGTWEHRFYVYDKLLSSANTGDRFIWNVRESNNNNALSLAVNAGQFKVMAGSKTYNISVTQGWNELAVSWSGSTMIVVMNGIEVVNVNDISIPSNLSNVMYVGASNESQQANTLHDCVRISNVSKTTEELQNAYNTVWEVDTATSMLMKFDGNLNLDSGDYTQVNTFEVGGTYNPRPVFTITTLNQTNEFVITLDTGEFLRVQTTINPYDVIAIDCNKNLVTINGQRALENLDIDSQFFDLNLGENTITLTEGLNAEVIINYTERWG